MGQGSVLTLLYTLKPHEIYLQEVGFSALGQPMTLYAPLYPILLGVGAVFEHGDVLQAGRLLCAFFFGANVALLGLAVLICTELSLSAMVCTMCVFLVSKPIIEMHSMAMSDAPFISFALAAFRADVLPCCPS